MECSERVSVDVRHVLRKHRDFVPSVGTVGKMGRETDAELVRWGEGRKVESGSETHT